MLSSLDELIITIKIIFLRRDYLHRRENWFDKNRSILPHLHQQLFNLHIPGIIISLELSIQMPLNQLFDRGITRQKPSLDENNSIRVHI